MDTPRTNLGDASYMGRPPPDFDMTQEPSFQSPSKDNNLLQQMRNGRAVSLRTPRGSRAPLGDKRNLPAGIGGSEFTPMLKSATRNSARRRGKENTNGMATPGLGKIDEDMDMTNVPVESSLFGPSRNMSYVDATPLPEVDASSTTSTPMVLPTRRGGSKGPLQDGNQLSLREQESVIDKIEKENFGLKLKIHFLEEALRKAGPGFNQAALKENTELKVDKVTMQKELYSYKKQLASAERNLETYQQQILDVQEKAKKKYADQSQRAENDALRRRLEDKEAEIGDLQQKLQQQSQDDADVDQLHDKIYDLEADLRAKSREVDEREDDMDELRTQLGQMERKWKTAEEKITGLEQLEDANAGQIELQEKIHDLEADLRTKDREMNEREDEIIQLRTKLEEVGEQWKTAQEKITALERLETRQDANAEQIEGLHGKIRNLETDLQKKDTELGEQDEELNELQEQLANAEENWQTAQQRIAELEENGQLSDDLAIAKETIEGLEDKIRHLEQQLGNVKDQMKLAVADKNRAESNLEELQEELSNKSVVTKGLSRQVEEKVRRLQSELSTAQEKYNALEHHAAEKERLSQEIKARAEQLLQQREAWERDRYTLSSKLEMAQNDLSTRTDEKNLLQLRHDALGDESASLRRDVARLEKQVASLEHRLEQEKAHALQVDREAQSAHQSEVDRLKDDIADLQEEIKRVRQEAAGGQSASASLEREVSRLQKRASEQESALEQEKARALRVDRDTQRAHQSEVDRLKDNITDLQDELDRVRQEVSGGQSASASLEREVSRLQKRINELESALEQEKMRALELEKAIGKHKNDEVALSRQIDELQRDLEARQSALTSPRKDISKLRADLHQSELNRQAQAEQIEELEDEVEVLQATLDEESEDANQKLRQADELCQDLRRQLEMARRDQGQRADRLDQLEDANRVAEKLRQQLREARQNLYDVEQERDDLKRKVDGTSRQESRDVAQANQATEDLKRQLLRAQKESKKAKALCEDLRSQLDAAQRDLDYANPLCKELRQKLDRARSERATYKASAEKLQVDCERLKKGAQEALAWIQAKNAETPSTGSVAPGPIKKAAMATFRYGDVVMDVVDQKDHEAVIRAADSAQRRHEKEIRGMALQMEWMQARWERESKLRNDGAFAKKFLQLRLDIADACNKADLRILNRIHQDLGLKSPAELLSKRQKNRKPLNNLKVFVGVIRAVARMRIEARKWGDHEKTRQRLVAAWEDQKQKRVLC